MGAGRKGIQRVSNHLLKYDTHAPCQGITAVPRVCAFSLASLVSKTELSTHSGWRNSKGGSKGEWQGWGGGRANALTYDLSFAFAAPDITSFFRIRDSQWLPAVPPPPASSISTPVKLAQSKNSRPFASTRGVIICL